MATYKAVMRPALEYASSVWSPIASSTSINKGVVKPWHGGRVALIEVAGIILIYLFNYICVCLFS